MSTVTSRNRHLTRAASRRKGTSFAAVRAILKEVAESRKETELQMKDTDQRLKETDRLIKELREERREEQKEIELQMKELRESQKETDRIVRRNGKQLGEVHRRFGQLAEHLVAPGIAKRFNELGYHFDVMSPKGQKILDEQGKIKTEIDLVLENGKTIMAVEVKAKPAEQDIEHHIKRLEILREKRNMLDDRRKVLGAIAGAIFEEDVKKATREAGLFVIEQSGDTMKIDVPDGFVPREW